HGGRARGGLTRSGRNPNGRNGSAADRGLPSWLPVPVRRLLSGTGRSGGTFGRALTVAGVGLVLVLGAGAVRSALQPAPPQPSRMVLHMVDAGGGNRAGTQLTPGSAVTVYVSTGQVPVPDEIGRPLSAAVQVLRDQLHLQVTIGWHGHQAADGVVIGQSVRGGRVTQGSRVTLTADPWSAAGSPTGTPSPTGSPPGTPAPSPANPA
ncbi:MAG TPA: hypothetical protein VFP72_05285, partial [Kineosporiaceae bacterium]|nr:hypothetical protein [Kineosporiaceae bacterium]